MDTSAPNIAAQAPNLAAPVPTPAVSAPEPQIPTFKLVLVGDGGTGKVSEHCPNSSDWFMGFCTIYTYETRSTIRADLNILPSSSHIDLIAFQVMADVLPCRLHS